MFLINFNPVLDYHEAVERMQQNESVIMIDKKLNSKDSPRIKYLDSFEFDEIPKSIFYTLLGRKLITLQHETKLPNGTTIETYVLNKENCDKLNEI